VIDPPRKLVRSRQTPSWPFLTQAFLACKDRSGLFRPACKSRPFPFPALGRKKRPLFSYSTFPWRFFLNRRQWLKKRSSPSPNSPLPFSGDVLFSVVLGNQRRKRSPHQVNSFSVNRPGWNDCFSPPLSVRNFPFFGSSEVVSFFFPVNSRCEAKTSPCSGLSHRRIAALLPLSLI